MAKGAISTQPIPIIELTPPTPLISASPISDSVHQQKNTAISNFSLLQVPLHHVRSEMINAVNEEVAQAKNDANSALINAEKASVHLARRTFILKTVVAGISLGSLLLSTIPTVLSGGSASLLTAVLIPLTVLAISDAACACADWQYKKTGKNGLPMKSDSLGNLFYTIIKLFHLKESTTQKAAKRSSIVVKVIFTVGILWAIDTGKDFLLESDEITTPLGGVVKNLADIFLTKSGLTGTEESVQGLVNKKINAKHLLNQIKLQNLQLDLLIQQQKQAENEFYNEFLGVIKDAEQYIQSKQLERNEQKKMSEAWGQIIECFDKSTADRFKSVKAREAEKSNVAGKGRRHLSVTGEQIFSPSQVALPKTNHQIKSLVTNAKDASRQARESFVLYQVSAVKHARKSFIGKLIKIPLTILGLVVAIAATATSMGAASPLIVFVLGSLVISVGDAVHAYKDWKLKVHKQDGMPYGSDWIANVEYQRLIKQRSEKQAANRAQAATVVSRLVFTAGSSLSAGEQVEFIDSIDGVLGKIDYICDNICEELDGEDNMNLQSNIMQSTHQDAEQIQEAMYHRQIANTAHADNTAIIRKKSEQEMNRLMYQCIKTEEERVLLERLNNAYVGAFNALSDEIKNKLEPLVQANPELCKQKELQCSLVSRDLTFKWTDSVCSRSSFFA
ncbi:MAG: hypothetical protein HAW66_07560 [Shewanella sp.]|nr:hypothetical protein [Shewanella sp.]